MPLSSTTPQFYPPSAAYRQSGDVQQERRGPALLIVTMVVEPAARSGPTWVGFPSRPAIVETEHADAAGLEWRDSLIDGFFVLVGGNEHRVQWQIGEIGRRIHG